MTPGLLDMPEDVMNRIMEDVGVKAIFTLRKVCHDFRNYIDDVKPDAKLKFIVICAGLDSIIVYYGFFEEVLISVEVKYKRHKEGCLVETCEESDVPFENFADLIDVNEHQIKSGILLKNEDFAAVFLKDFQFVLEHQKSVLEKFKLCPDENGTVLKNVQHVLESRVCPLKVETFTAEYMDQNQLMSILPFLDSKTLNALELGFTKNDITRIDELVKLDHWKNAQHMHFTSAIDYNNFQHFTHFPKAFVSFSSDHFPDLTSLKNIFLQSSGFQSIYIKLTNYESDDVDQSTEPLGQAFIKLDHNWTSHTWYYRIPATEDILDICLFCDESNGTDELSIKLKRIENSKVPQEAVIQN